MTGNTFHDRKWMCLHCGYAMDAASNAFGTSAPVEDDLSVCMNCGWVYTRHGGQWHATTPSEWAALDIGTKMAIAKIQLTIEHTIKEDLTKRYPRA